MNCTIIANRIWPILLLGIRHKIPAAKLGKLLRELARQIEMIE